MQKRDSVRVLGYCQNSSFLINLYTRISDFPTLIQDERYLGVDETKLCHITWTGSPKSDLPKDSWTFIVDDALNKKEITACFQSINVEKIHPNNVLRVEDGSIYLNDDEIAYFHYVCNKTDKKFIFPKWKKLENRFFITETGFYTLSEFNAINQAYRKVNGLKKRVFEKLKSKLFFL